MSDVTQERYDELVKVNRRQVAQIERLQQENEDQREQLGDARALLFAFRQLLAVIFKFANLPLPVKAAWNDYYRTGMQRLDQLRYMANELQGAHVRTHDAERWTELLVGYVEAPYPYEIEAGAQPKPKPAELGADAVTE